MVGDREHDIIGARTNEIRSIGALWVTGVARNRNAGAMSAFLSQRNSLLQFIYSNGADKAASTQARVQTSDRAECLKLEVVQKKDGAIL